MSYAENLKANREDIIDIINDERQGTNITLKQAMELIAAKEARYNELFVKCAANSLYSHEMATFKELILEVITEIYRTPSHTSSINADLNKVYDQEVADRKKAMQIHL